MNQKGFSNILIVVIALIIILGVGGYFVLQQSGRKQTPPSSLESEQEAVSPQQSDIPNDETSNWEVYHSSEFGYEFRYPSEWLVEEIDGQVRVISPDTKIGSSITSGGMIFVVSKLELEESDKDKQEFLGELKKQLEKGIEENQDGYIAGVPRTTRVDIETDTSYRKVIEFLNGEVFYSIDLLYGASKQTGKIDDAIGDEIKQDQQKILSLQNKVVSTFKFIE